VFEAVAGCVEDELRFFLDVTGVVCEGKGEGFRYVVGEKWSGGWFTVVCWDLFLGFG
jgi:hypothetical protein